MNREEIARLINERIHQVGKVEPSTIVMENGNRHLCYPFELKLGPDFEPLLVVLDHATNSKFAFDPRKINEVS